MVKILFNTLGGIALIIIWLQFVDIQQIWQTISKVKFINLLPVFFFMLLSPVARAIRFKIFLHKIKRIRFLDLVFLNGVAMMLNFLIPVRAGEIAKGVYLNTHYSLPLAKSVIWVFLDRFIDFLVVLLLVAVLVLIIPTSLPQSFISTLSLILAVTMIAAYLAVFQSNFAKKLVNFLKHLLIEKHIKIYFVKITSLILDSFAILRRNPVELLLLATVTIVAYGADAAIWYFTFLALNVPQDILKMYLGQLLSALAYLIPAAPGYVGSAEASGVLILSGIFAVEVNLASSMIVLFHLTSAIFILVFGLISVFRLNLDLGLILRKALNRS